MAKILFLGVLAIVVVRGQSQVVSPPVVEQAFLSANATPCEQACALLRSRLSNHVFQGKSGNFSFWDTKQQVTPACRVEPESAQDIVKILDTVKEKKCHFAIKSGGHARWKGASNAEGGVTIDLVKMNAIKLSPDKKDVTIGAGSRWADVYRSLEADDLTVIGGRVATVGVGGVILGGGISFFSGRHGLACDNVISYEIVLPSSEITTASEKSHPDIYKALKGAGSSNFGIVTSFHMSTIPLANPAGLWSDIRTYSWDKVPALRKARLEWVTSGVDEDFDTGGYEVFGYAGIYNMSIAMVQHFHTKHLSASSWPAVFSQYKDLEPLPMEGADLQRILPMSDITVEISGSNAYGRRNTYATFTYKPTEELDVALFKIFEEGLEKIKHVPGILAFMPLQPLSRRAISQMSQRGGNSLGLKESDAPLVIYLQSWQWDNEADDALIFETTKEILRKSETVAKDMGLWHRFKYINYAEEWQAEDIYPGYGEDNWKQLKALQRKVDPEGVFTKGGLCYGYFRLNEKLEKAGKDRDEL